ncbi:MAG: hypothetical protein U1F43_36590 [Myxococcota bacterium]
MLLEPMANDADPMVAALALRMLGYVALNNGFDAATATATYEKALALDETYGEAHYALAFVLAISDKEKGKVHFERALALGVSRRAACAISSTAPPRLAPSRPRPRRRTPDGARSRRCSPATSRGEEFQTARLTPRTRVSSLPALNGPECQWAP